MSVFVTVNDNHAWEPHLPMRESMVTAIADLHPAVRSVMEYEAEHGVWHRAAPCPWKDEDQ